MIDAAAFPRPRAVRLGLPPTLLAGVVLIGLWIVVAIGADWIAPYGPLEQDLSRTLQAPSALHWLGTDNYGRDVLSRILHAARLDLQIAVLGVLFPFLIGNLVGLLSGYLGGWTDVVAMRLLEVTMAFPFLVLVIAIIAVLGPGLGSLYVALALVGWVSYARLTRAQVLVLKSADFVSAARVMGLGTWRVMWRHLLPNAVTPAVVFAMTDAVLVVLLGSALSYLGLGAQPPAAEWGVMIAEGQQFLASAWWICLFPGLAIVSLALGFSLLADGLADLLGTRP